jgi:hypothetical protein
MQYTNFWLITLDADGNKKTCDYWYLIQTYGGTAHTAFNQLSSLRQWASERGIPLPESLPERGTHSSHKLIGAYRQQMHGSYDEFFALKGVRSRTLSNGDYTLAIITDDEDGIKTVHTLNPNCHDRPVFDYQSSRAMQG